jgi:error-prone DNA polymerase
MIKGLSRAGAERLIVARTQQTFRTAEDLARRARLDRGDLEALAAANALVTLAGHRYLARWACAGLEPERPLLEHSCVAEDTPLLKSPSEGDELVADYASLGLSLGRHPLALLRSRLNALGLRSARHIHACKHGRFARTAGIVTGRQSPGNASGVIFVTLEDETGVTQVIIWPRLAQQQRSVLLQTRLLAVAGEVQREGSVVHLIARHLEDHSHLLGKLITQSRDFH